MLSHTGDTVKFDGLLGVTADGVPVMSNGSELHYSNTPSIIPAAQPLSSFERARCDVESLPQLGVKWQCVEFVRRYLAATKAVWLASVPTAEDLWTHDGDLFSYISTNQPVPYLRIVNGEDRISPQVGDIVVWSQCERMPFGHVAVVTESPDNKHVRVAEQNHGFSAWPVDAPFSRELEVRFHSDDSAELWDAEGVAVLGWLRVDAPPYDFTRGNICDDYRMVLGNGSIERHHVQSEVTVPWLNPSSSSLDLVLKRSLCHDGCTDNGAEASVEDVPSGIYFLDYDMWCSIGRAAKSLHAIAMQATENVLSDPDSEYLLEHYFGVVPHLQPLLRQSWETTQALGGRFDFGFNGKSVGMFEYNCDSSGALLECCDTQEKIAKHYGVQAGLSAGSFLSAKCVTYFKRLLSNSVMCPSHALIHFLIDNDDEERYTAMCMMGFAETAGFRTKLLQSPTALHFGDANTPEDGERPQYEDREIFDEDNERVMLVWKTWSWDTVLHQYERQWIKDSPNPRSIGAPTLSDVLLNDTVKVLEPLWKAVTGSKAVLPFMYSMARDHPHMLPASFFRTREIISGNYISKPVNGRAGQNITMHDPVVDKTELDNAPRVEGDHPLHLAEPRTLSPSRANSSRGDSFFPSSFAVSCDDNGNECSPGRFFDSVEVFQKRLFLKKFDSKYFPIFCAWMVGDEFGGVVVREDTSKITKLGSVVVPARVLRNTRLLDGNAK